MRARSPEATSSARTPGSPQKGSFLDLRSTSLLSRRIFFGGGEDDGGIGKAFACRAVRGERRLGLVIGPGAAKGLGGAAGLREVCEMLLWPR
eukprot:543301-Pyramimonas_sp.AAC.1